ncbi:hypothetical protein AK88_05373, partial [Plasmodium fragile]
MSEVNIIFNEVTKIITKRSGPNAGICGIIYDGAETNVATCKSRCMEIAKLMLYIKGYSYKNRAWTKRRVDDRRRAPFTEYLRCTLGTEVLLQLYGNTEDHREIIENVEQHMRNTDKSGKQQYEPGVCEDRNYGPVIFGLRGIGPSIKTKLDEWKSGLAAGQAGRNTGTTHGTGQKCAWREQEADQKNEEACSAQAGVITKDSEFMKRINHWTDGGLYPRVTKLLKDIHNNGGSKEKCEIEKKIKEGVQKVKDTVNPPAKIPKVTKPGPNAPGTAKVATPTSHGAGSAPKHDPAKPAPAKPNNGGTAAKPVAAKPAGPVATNAGKTKTTGATDGVKAKETQADDCQGDKVWEWREREIYVAHQYTADQWEPVKNVLNDFIKYVQENNELFDAQGANCDNKGWNDMDQYSRMGQRVADVMRCRIMSGALWFANGAGNNKEEWEKKSEGEKKEIERLRCEVAHVFGHLLKTRYCQGTQPWYRGVEYAYKAMQRMGDTKPGHTAGIPGPVVEGRCTMCGYEGHKHNVQAVNLEIAQWLMYDGGIIEEIKKLEGTMPCAQYWDQYIHKAATKGDPMETILTTEGMNEKKRLDKEIVEKAKQAFEKAKTKVQDKITELEASDNTKGKDVKTADKKADKDTDKQKQHESSSTLPTQHANSQEGKNTVSSSTDSSHLGRTDATAGGEQGVGTPGSSPTGSGPQPQAPASPVLPARPPLTPPPRRPSTPRQGSDPGRQAAGTAGASTDTKAKDSDAKSPGQPTCPGSNGTSQGVSIRCGSTSDSDLGLTPAATTLLEEADKNKEGSSGPGSAGTGTTGQAQPGGSQEGPRAAPKEDTGSGLTKTEDKKELMNDQGTFWPGLTWEDVKSYTPAIIPAVVGIGVIAFFLWK